MTDFVAKIYEVKREISGFKKDVINDTQEIRRIERYINHTKRLIEKREKILAALREEEARRQGS